MFKLCVLVIMAALFREQVECHPSSAVNQNVTKLLEQEAGGGEGYILVASGHNGATQEKGYAYDISAGTWSALPNLPTGRRGGGMITHQGNVYYASGYGASGYHDFLLMSTQQNKWIQGAPLQSIAYDGVNAVSFNDSIFVVGGNTNHLEKFTCVGGKYVWNQMPNTAQTHFYSGATGLNGKVYICGTTFNNPSTFCQRFDPATNQYETIAPMNEARYSFSMVSLNGYVYVIGGADANNERYDPTRDEWTHFSHVPQQKYYQAAATDGRRIYVVGGSDYTDLFTMYVPELDIWQTETPYPYKMRQAGATFVKTIP